MNDKFFKFDQSNRIAGLIKDKYDNNPEFLWENSDAAIFRNKSSGKWYGIIMRITKDKLGEISKKEVEVLNIKLDTDEIMLLLNEAGFYPAYHMSKHNWISITLDDTVPDDEIMNFISESFSLTSKKHK